jgi:hypothetical protein
MKHKFLNEKLQLERKELEPIITTAGALVTASINNTAAITANLPFAEEEETPF